LFSLVSFIRANWVYIAIAAYATFLGFTHWYAFNLGGKLKEAKIITKVVEAQNESKKEADHVRIKEQRLDDNELDDALCGLGIVRQQHGCR
jgi:hypothetical protein